MTHQQIIELLNFRHACKVFDQTKKISQADMELIMKSAQLSPSSMGLEPWEFVVVTNKDLITDLIPLTPGGTKQLETCSHLVLAFSRVANDLKHQSPYLDHLLKDVKELPAETATKFKQAIANIEANRFNYSDQAMDHYSASQAYLAVANMALTAAMLKVDSCIIGGFDSKAVSKLLISKQILDPAHFNLTLMLPLGYRLNPASAKKRRPIQDVISWVE